MLCVLKIPTNFCVVLRSFCQNQNPVQNQDHDFTLNFNIRSTFHTWKTPSKFFLDLLTPSNVIVSTAKVHVQPYIQTDMKTGRQTEIFFLVLSSETYKIWTFIKRRFFFTFSSHTEYVKRESIVFHSCDYNTFSFYILRMWCESKKRKMLLGRLNKLKIL